MGKFISGILFSLLFLLGYVAYPQEIISQFDLKPSENVRLVDLADNPILFLENFNRYRFVYLDNQLQKQELLTIDKIDPRIYDLYVRGMFRREGMIYLLLRAHDNPYWNILAIDESAQTSKLLEPHEFLSVQEKRADLINLNHFQDSNRYYIFQAIRHEDESSLRIFEIEGHDKFIQKEIKLPVSQFFKRCKINQSVIPLMTDSLDLSIPSSACDLKLYAYPQKFLLTIDMVVYEEDTQVVTKVFTIDRKTWALSESTYPYLRLTDSLETRHNANSFIYKNHLYQGIVSEDKLQILKKEMPSGTQLDQVSWENDVALSEYYNAGPVRLSYDNNGRWKPKTIDKFLKHLPGNHFGFLIKPINEEIDQIVIGAHKYKNRNFEEGFRIATFVLATGLNAMGAASFSTGQGIGTFYYPAYQQTATTSRLAQAQDRIFLLEGYLSKNTFTPADSDLPPNPIKKIDSYSIKHKLDKKSWGRIILGSSSGFKLGYGRKKQYQFIEFSSSEEE